MTQAYAQGIRPASNLNEGKAMVLPQQPATLIAPAPRRKLQKAPRQRYRTSPKQPFRTVPLSRSPSTRSDNSRGHLLPSDAQNRAVHLSRYPGRSNQPSVLRKRRNDSAAGRRTYHTFPQAAQAVAVTPRFPTGYVPQHESPDRYNNLGHEPLLQRVPEQESQQPAAEPEVSPPLPEPQPATEHGILLQSLSPHQSVAPGQIFRHPSQTSLSTTSWAQRRWTMSEPLPSPSVAAGASGNIGAPVVMNNAQPRPLSQRLEKALPSLPEPTPVLTASQSKQLEAAASSQQNRNRHSSLLPPPLYTEDSSGSSSSNCLTITNPPPPHTPLDTAYHTRLITDFIRDERAYLDTLRQSVKNEVIFATSVDLLLSLLSVIQASEDLVSRVEADHTLRGVGAAFLGLCRPLETALMRWSEEIARLKREEVEERERKQKALPPTPEAEVREKGESSSRRNFLLKRVSTLWGKGKPSRRQGGTSQMPQPKPDWIWQTPTNESGPGLWEMSVLPSQRLTQYRYLLRELLATLPETHPTYTGLDRASHGVAFISEKLVRAQERAQELESR